RYLQRADHRLGVRIAQTPDGGLRFNPNTSEDLLIDDFGHVLRQVLPDHGTKTARYDAAGRIVDIASVDGSRTAYTYDAAGRLIRKDLFDAQGQTAEAVALTYAGHTLASRSDGAQTSRFGYDAFGRKTQEAISLSGLDQVFTTHTRFDPDSGLVSARVLADGRVLRIARTDARHGATASSLRLQAAWAAAIEDWLSEHVARGLGETVGRWLPDTTIADQIRIDPFDGLSAYTAGNGIVTRRSYDTAGRLTVLDIDGIDRTDYRYGNGPRIKSIDSPLLKADYRYTGFGQLRPDPPNEPTPARREARHPANTAGTAVTRDALGRTVEDARFRYTYTVSGQLDTVTDRTTRQRVARYRYNSLGQRVAKTVIGQGRDTTTWTLWLDGKRVAELDASGAIQTQYLYLSESKRTTPVARLDASATYFIHTDHRGGPIAMTDKRKVIVWRATLTPWGLAMPQGAASSPPAPTEAVVPLSHFGVEPLNLRLPGQYFDAETGLHDNWHRTYDPRTGRYL
ncbi:RHS domain-containing protein, partial [Azoarcus sp. L1K30]|uniref:RHS domain-containing protein n=1 Tax=Azoarcus sp. L1K30 TaxID=2820277 RepID=UPI001B8268DF